MVIDTRTREALVLGHIERNYGGQSLADWSDWLRCEASWAISELSNRGQADDYTSKKIADVLNEWFGVLDENHPFSVEPQEWLNLTETQVMAGLSHFAKRCGENGVLALFKAAVPSAEIGGIAEDRHNDRKCGCETEVVVQGSRSRIDMLVTIEDKAQIHILVIEAKWGSSIAKNPLSEYRNYAKKTADKTECIILDFALNSKTESRLRRNKDWRFLSWHVFLRRLEKWFPNPEADDLAFLNFRGQVWDKL